MELGINLRNFKEIYKYEEFRIGLYCPPSNENKFKYAIVVDEDRIIMENDDLWKLVAQLEMILKLSNKNFQGNLVLELLEREEYRVRDKIERKKFPGYIKDWYEYANAFGYIVELHYHTKENDVRKLVDISFRVKR